MRTQVSFYEKDPNDKTKYNARSRLSIASGTECNAIKNTMKEGHVNRHSKGD
jgi:hypothetical protein